MKQRKRVKLKFINHSLNGIIVTWDCPVIGWADKKDYSTVAQFTIDSNGKPYHVWINATS